MTLFRAPVVSEFQKTKVANVQKRWQIFTLVQWAVMAGAAYAAIAHTEYRGDSNGDHALRPLQHGINTMKEAFVTGDISRISFSPPPLPKRAEQRQEETASARMR